jgi:hypothetical protein
VLDHPRRMRAGACFLGLLLLAACGGKVVVDTDTSGSTGTGTTGDLTCEEVCVKTVAACPGTNSVQQCMTGCATTDKVANAACPAAYQAFLMCADAHPASQCDGSNACQAEVAALTTCITQVCEANPIQCLP